MEVKETLCHIRYLLALERLTHSGAGGMCVFKGSLSIQTAEDPGLCPSPPLLFTALPLLPLLFFFFPSPL